MADIVRKHIIFHGSVQGVGFRYYSEHKANQLRLTG
ncbi:acylphosphatase, partial [Clostridium sp. AF15-6B]